MISDVLHEAGAEIDRYLRDFPLAYPENAPLTTRIALLRKEMREIQYILDTPPKAAGG